MNNDRKEYSFGAYEVLGINPSACYSEIKNAYRRKAMENHPDRGGDVHYFQEIQSAYVVLSDPMKRSLHDSHFKGYDVACIIRKTRKGMGLTQVEFADLLGISQKTVVFYEQGRFKPRRKTAAKIIEVARKYSIHLGMEDFGFQGKR